MIVPGGGFIPSVGGAGDTYWDNVVLLMHFDGNFNDEKGHVITDGMVSHLKYPPDPVKYGAGSYSTFDIDSKIGFTHSDFAFSSVALTIEAYVYRPSATPKSALIIRTQTGNGVVLGFDGNGALFVSDGGAYIAYTADNFGSRDVWQHIAMTRDGAGNIKLFLNGSIVASGSGNFTNNTTIRVMGPISGAGNYIDELRITKGVARYTANFTPPTAPFPNHG